MANITDTTKLDRLWKLSFNKARGDNATQFFEELIPTVADVHAGDIPSQSIPGTPPADTTTIIKKWYLGFGGRIAMTLDRKYNGNRVWVAKLSFNSAFSSGSGTLTDIMKNFVSPKYGAGYVVKVYDSSNNQISELFGDASGSMNTGSWLFDYKSGVLAFESDRSETGNNSTDCIKIDIYQYIGKFLDAAGTVGGTAGDIAVLDAGGAVIDSGLTIADIKDKNYVYEQLSAASTWTVAHNLAKYPSVQVVDSGGTVVIGEIDYIDANNVRLRFNSGFAGVAYFN